VGVKGEEDTEQVEKPRAGAEHRRGAKEERQRKNEERDFGRLRRVRTRRNKKTGRRRG
jgi:hypothetical protein